MGMPQYLKQPPFAMLYHSNMWIQVFFMLSGFMLPLNFFKTGKHAGFVSIFRRYLRLMLPVLMILSIYLLLARLDCFSSGTLSNLKNKTMKDLFISAILETSYD